MLFRSMIASSPPLRSSRPVSASASTPALSHIPVSGDRGHGGGDRGLLADAGGAAPGAGGVVGGGGVARAPPAGPSPGHPRRALLPGEAPQVPRPPPPHPLRRPRRGLRAAPLQGPRRRLAAPVSAAWAAHGSVGLG